MNIITKNFIATIGYIMLVYLNVSMSFAQVYSIEGYTIEKGRSLFLQLTQGTVQSKECKSFFSKLLHENDVHHGLVKTYLAMITAIESRDTMLPWKKLKLAEKAMASLDDQVHQYPNHFEIRLLRFALTQQLPFFLRNDLQVAEEKKYLISQFESNKDHLHTLVYKMALDLLTH